MKYLKLILSDYLIAEAMIQNTEIIMIENDNLVSVIIPVYNGELYLDEAIESALGQPYRPIEVIVVDDGSTDGSAEVAKQFDSPMRYCFQPNAGLGAARNKGISLAQGSFFAFLDADDLWLENKLTRQMALFDKNPELDKDRFVFCLNRPSGTHMANYLYDISMSGSPKHVISAATVLAVVFLRLLL